MFDNINKSKIAFEKYVELKEKSLTNNYTEKFKLVDRFLYWFSWFGNGVSIFLAFFFLQAIFNNAFVDVQGNILVSLGIICFLTMFELLKRYVIGIFSSEVIKNKFRVFKWNMTGFILGVLMLAGGSIYMTLHGAQKFVDKGNQLQTQTEQTISTESDKLTDNYESQKKSYLEENDKLRNINNDLRQKLASTDVKLTSVRKNYQSSIDKNDEIISKNQSQIDKLDNKLNSKIDEVKNKQLTDLNKSLSSNQSNMVTFIIISLLIEIIILIGVYYDKFYKYMVITEYEKTVVETPEFKKWYKFNYILSLIYSKTKEIDTPIPSSNALLEMSEVNGNKIDKSTLDKFIKILYYLEIIRLEGNRRVLNMNEEEGIKKLRDYFDIK